MPRFLERNEILCVRTELHTHEALGLVPTQDVVAPSWITTGEEYAFAPVESVARSVLRSAGLSAERRFTPPATTHTLVPTGRLTFQVKGEVEVSGNCNRATADSSAAGRTAIK